MKLGFRGSAISSDGGLLLYRELDDALGLTDLAVRVLADPRTGKNGRHHLGGLIRIANAPIGVGCLRFEALSDRTYSNATKRRVRHMLQPVRPCAYGSHLGNACFISARTGLHGLFRQADGMAGCRGT